MFTTRPDTVFGVTFMSIAPEHALVDEIVSNEQRPAVEAFRAELANLSEEERTGDQAEKKGVFTAFAINPVNGDQIPVMSRTLFSGLWHWCRYGSTSPRYA